MQPIRLSLLTTLVLSSCALFLSACEGAKEALAVAKYTADELFDREDVNLVEKNNAATDYMVQQLDSFIDRTDAISIQPLTLIGEPAITSELGTTITQQVGERLSQLGYTVLFSPSMPGYVHGVEPEDGHAKFTVGGTYSTQKRAVDISLRTVRKKDGRIVGRFDYTLPRTGELKDLSESKAQIVRVSE